MSDQNLSLNYPYFRNLANRLIPYEKYNSHEPQAYIDFADYEPARIAGGSLHAQSNISQVDHAKIAKLIDKYGLDPNEIHGSGWLNIAALKKTAKELIFDNQYVLIVIKIGAVAAVSALLASLGMPAPLVAMTPVLIAWSQLAVQDYLKHKKELEKQQGNGYFQDLANSDNIQKGLQRLDQYGEMVQSDVGHIKQAYANRRKAPAKKGGKLPQLNYLSGIPLASPYAQNLIKPRGRPQKRPHLEFENNPDVGIYEGGAKRKPARRAAANPDNARARRGAKIKEIMHSQGLTMVQASKYIKNNNIDY